MGKTIWDTLKETFGDYIEDNALSRGAALAYYTILSLGPILVICIAIAGLAFGPEAAQGAIVGQLKGLMGDQAAEVIQSAIKSASNKTSGIWATILGFLTLLITATGVFGEMQTSLNAIWKAEPKGGLTAMLKARAASLGLVATLGFLLLVSLVVGAGLHALGDYLNQFLPEAALLFQILNVIVSFLIISVLFAAIYKILPDRQLAWKDVMVGALVTAFLFTVGKTLIGLYIGSSSMASSFGAASALIIILAWIYYSSQIFLLGAEFTKVWASHHGSKEAFAARNATAPGNTPGAAPGSAPGGTPGNTPGGATGGAPPPHGPATAVQNIVAHTAANRRGVGFFEVAAVATLLVVAREMVKTGSPRR